MISARYAHILFGFILSGTMSLIVSGIATFRAIGPTDGFGMAWMLAWASSWAIAFPAVLVMAPITRRVVARMTRSD